MKNFKKKITMALCLMIAMSAAAPSFASFADEDEDTVISEEAETEEASEDGVEEAVPYTLEEEEVITAGDFKYTLNEDGNAVIVGCHVMGEEIIVPESIDGHTVTEIGSGTAFENLHAKKITIPASVEYITTDNPFVPLLSLEEISVDEENKEYVSEDGVIYSKDKKMIISYPAAKAGKTFTIPDGVETVCVAAFSENSLEEIILPASIKTLERHCFSFDEKLKRIDLSKTSVTEIPIMAFASSTALEEVILPEGLLSVGLASFYGCSSLENIEFPESLELINQSAFQGAALTRVIIPSSVQTIGYSAFGYNEDNTTNNEFTLVGESGSAAEKYCKDRDEEYNYVNDFNFMSLETYKRELEYEAMDAIDFGDYKYIIKDNEVCIISCTSVSESIDVPEDIDGMPVTEIYYGAFLNCSCEAVNLPDSVRKIGEDAFSQYVVKIKISGNCEEIEGEEPFLRCLKLQNIEVGEGEGNYSAENGILYDKDKTILLAYPQAKQDKEIVLPNTVKEIAVSGCCYNVNLEKIDLSNVETIGNYAFEGCLALKNVKLSKNLKVVGQNAFLGCAEMKSIRVYGEVETIGDYAFGYNYDEEIAESVEKNPEAYALQGETVVMPYSVMSDFKMYVEKDSLAHKYAQACGITAVTGTTEIGGRNVDTGFIYAILGIIGAVLAALFGIFTGRRIKQNKKKKEAAEKKAKAAEKKAEGRDKTDEK